MTMPMTLQPMQDADTPLEGADPITVPYTPSELSFSKAMQYGEVAIPGLNQPLIQFVRGDAETISLDLFFDATDPGADASVLGTGGERSVTKPVEALAKLVAVTDKLHRPPLVRVSWGKNFPISAQSKDATAEPTFLAIVTNMTRNYTLFDRLGVPLRATVTVALKRYATIAQQLQEMNLQSADHTRLHTVAEGETLPLIAHDAYADAGLWRVIADYNNLSDVTSLAPGTQLELPPLVT
jgi:hypothetical protein